MTKRAAHRGFTIIELLIATFIIGTVVTGLFGLFVLNLRAAQEGERRLVAIALANERAEMIRNLPYSNVGTSGGIPAGSILQEEVIARPTSTYTVRTDVRYVDDSFDGTAGGAPNDTVNTDYKQARIEVAWQSPSSPAPILLVMVVAPPGVEGGEAAGTLSFQALNAAAAGIPDASLRIVNMATNPTIDVTTNTDNNGRILLPGLPESAGSYELTLTKAGYTSEQTYTETATFIPDTDHAHLSMLQGQVTPKTFSIDLVSEMAIATQDEELQPLGNIAYSLRGTKTIGVDETETPVYRLNVQEQTNASGTATHPDIIWDSYDFSIDGLATGYDIKETSMLLPAKVNPGEQADLTVTLVPHTPISLHVTVATPEGLPIDNATVQLTQVGYDTTLGTGALGQVLFTDLPFNADYTLSITAPGWQVFNEVITVTNTTRTRAELTSA